MIKVVDVSPDNERPVVQRLLASIRAAWPEVATSATDHVWVVTGVEVRRQIDLLVTIEFGAPRDLDPRARAGGVAAPGRSIQAAAIVVEIKQSDASRFTALGTELFVDYRDGQPPKSVNAQVRDCQQALVGHMRKYGVAPFYVHGIGWATEISAEQLLGVSPWIVGAEAGWLDILGAAGRQSTTLYGEKQPKEVASIGTIRETLTRRRAVSPLDREKANALCTDVIVDTLIRDLAQNAGHRQIRLTGRGGSGKTTTLALLAKHLAYVDGARVLILTFHKTLRGDIDHLLDTLIDVPGVKARNVAVQTATTFFVRALEELDIPLPMVADALDYAALPALLAALAAQMLADDGETAAYLAGVDPDRFSWDYVLVDEAQDWTDAERDVIRAMYGRENLVVADGLEQLVRRQTPCDWNTGVPKQQRYQRHLGSSLRMTANIARFANAFAREAGLADWKIEPFERSTGGRIIIYAGGVPDAAELVAEIRPLLRTGGADPVDALFCIPPKMVSTAATGRRQAVVAAQIGAAGYRCWDGSDPLARNTVPDDIEQWRVVQYDSCRGLEGWIAVAYGLDELVAVKEKHPNLQPGESASPQDVARRWVMIALTRAVSVLVITVTDPAAPLVTTLRAASERLPAGIVEWRASNGARRPP